MGSPPVDESSPSRALWRIVERPHRRNILRFVFGIAISIASLWLLLTLVDVGLITSTLRSADPWLVTVSVLALFASLIAKVARWRRLLPDTAEISFFQLLRIMYVSIFLNNVLPFRVGDVARGVMTSRRPGLNLGHVVSSMVAERALDAVTLLTCFVIATAFVGGRGLESQRRVGLITLLVIVGVLAVILVIYPLAKRSRIKLGPRWRVLLLALSDSWRRIASVRGWPIWAWSMIAWVFAFLINVALFEALGLEVSPVMAIVVTCTTNLSMLVPASPGHIGVYHAAATLTLVLGGMDSGSAASFAVLSHLVNVIPVSIAGAALLASPSFPGPRGFRSRVEAMTHPQDGSDA